jgi:hypothetical protein
MRRSAVLAVPLLLLAALALVSREPAADPRLKKASRAAEKNGWIAIHLEGAPAEIGFQHGYLLAPEIEDNYRALSLEMVHDEGKDWQFFRRAAQDVFWPRVDEEYRQELQGIADGLKARRSKLDVWDVVVLNASLEIPYYAKWHAKNRGAAAPGSVPERCSAFVATGGYTRDGRPVIGHNNWSSYNSGERWNVVFDIVPAKGNRILMDGMPGLIHSGDDFGINSAGILITETTISKFVGFDPKGVPEFVRARKAMQYAASIDDFARIMQDGNNGGYANTWLVADRKTGEIGSLELGLKNVTLQRTRDGYFVGSNFPQNPKLIEEETPGYPVDDASFGNNARRIRWKALMEENKGRIDVAAAQRFLGDHHDTWEKKEQASERTLCGHVDISPRGIPGWQAPFGMAGAVQSKATSAALAEKMTFTAALGHSCGVNFKAADHLRKHPEFAWVKSTLKDMPSRPWTTFAAKLIPQERHDAGSARRRRRL